jgi:3'-phosphoadenosine 5'-phosphosulfate sulfotransferase (PAPS reductase)/FAD synthetase
MTKHVVMFSGGIGSWATAKLVAEKHGTENLYLVFSDVKGKNPSPHIGEDEDTYRFIEEAAKNVGGTYIYLNEGRDIWEVFKDKKFLGNSRLAHCSHLLKQKPARKWLEDNCDPNETVVYVGIDWTETHRLKSIEKNYQPYTAVAPLAIEHYSNVKKYWDKAELIQWAKDEGLTTPRLYELGFAHNNCGGGCVRAGQGQFKQLLQIMPERFDVWEKKEQEIRDYLGKDVSILTEVVKGTKKSLPLSELRRRAEISPMLIDETDIGGCGCFFQEDEREIV